MKILDLFKKNAKRGESELDQILSTIIEIERKKETAEHELQRSREALQRAVAGEIGDGEKLGTSQSTDNVVRAQERLHAVDALLKQARSEGVGMIASSAAEDRTRLDACEKEIAETRAGIDARSIKIIAEFAQAHGFTVAWPTKSNGGTMSIPSMTLEGAELLEVADAVKTNPHRDPDADRLAALYAEKQRLNVVTYSTPEQALDHYLMERRRI